MSIDPTQRNVAHDSLLGMFRGAIIGTLVYPLKVVVVRQQCHRGPKTSAAVAWEMFQKEGIRPFYRGLSPQLIQTCINQAWVWPMMTSIPTYLKSYKLGEIPEQAGTGLAIATMETLTTPLEKVKIQSASSGKDHFSLANLYKNKWRGFTTRWMQLSVGWVTFLISQKYLRTQARQDPEQVLTLPELAGIGVQVGLIVGLVAPPFDNANTLKLAQNRKAREFLFQSSLRTLYRGGPLNAVSLMISNIASAILLDKLNQ